MVKPLDLARKFPAYSPTHDGSYPIDVNTIASKNKLLIPTLLIFALFFIVPLLAFPELIFSGKTLYRDDITWIHYPGHIFVADEWLAGRVPLWDPFRQAGKPMLAEPQIGVLYPLRVLFLSPLNPSLELSLFLFMHYTLAACFAFVLARSLNLSRWGATLAGLAFGFGGFLMAQNINLNIMTGAVWLPLVLGGAIETLKRRRWRVAMLAGMPIALQMYTAQPQITFYTLVMMSGYGAYQIVGDFFFGPHRYKLNYALITGLLLTTMVVSGLLLAAPQLIPTLEMLQYTIRLARQGFDLLTENSLPPAMWLNLLLPGAFGNGVVGFEGGDPFQEDFIYVGFMTLLLALFSWPRRRQPPVLFFMLLLLSAVLLAMGRYTPLYATVIQYLPGFDLFRIPARWVLGVNLALAILAGVGLDFLLEQGVSKTTLMIVVAIGTLLIVGLGLAWLGQETLMQWAETWSGLNRKLLRVFFDLSYTFNPIYDDRLLVGWMPYLTVPVVLLTTNIIIAVGLFTLYARRLMSPTRFAGLIVAAVTFDLIVAGGTVINPIKEATRWQQLSGGAQYVLEHVGQARVFPLSASSEETAISHLGQYFPSARRVHSAGGHAGPLVLQRYEDFINEAHPVQVIQILGVRYILTPGQMGADV
ncbi:MAG: YfhO family protein, partial [Anaerolineae bacterium]|nr:YfhO family protein [Anaerolineae bacterium]